MARLKILEVDSISKFTSKIEKLLEETQARSPDVPYAGNWYRGVSRSDHHHLVPTLYRHPNVKDIAELVGLEAMMIGDFERQNVLHSHPAGDSSSSVSGLKLLIYMQHYGIPTRLLDWTNNPFIALYFALSTAKKNENGVYAEDAAVWVLDPVKWNSVSLSQQSHGDEGPMDIEEAAKNYGPRKVFHGKLEPSALNQMLEGPAAILGISNSARMFAQRGVFTIFGKNAAPMEEQYVSGGFASGVLVKLVIPKEKIEVMLERLLKIGYTDSVSYPDLHGLALEIRRMRGFGV